MCWPPAFLRDREGQKSSFSAAHNGSLLRHTKPSSFMLESLQAFPALDLAYSASLPKVHCCCYFPSFSAGPLALLPLRTRLIPGLSRLLLLTAGLFYILDMPPFPKHTPEPTPLLPPDCSTLLELILICLDSCPPHPGSFTGKTSQSVALSHPYFYLPTEPQNKSLTTGDFSPATQPCGGLADTVTEVFSPSHFLPMTQEGSMSLFPDKVNPPS